MNGIFNLHISFISFLQEFFRFFWILSNCCGLPVIVCSWRINLCQMRSFLVITCYENWYSKRPVSSSLSFFLDKFWCVSTKSVNSYRFIILYPIVLNELSCFLRQKSKVRSKTWIYSSNVITKDLCFVIGRLVH